MNKINNLIRNWHIVLIIILSFWPFLWLKPDYIIAGGDQYSAIRPATNFFRHFYAWEDALSLGKIDLDVARLFPMEAFFYLLTTLGINNSLGQIIWEIGLLMVGGLGMARLLDFFFFKNRLVNKNKLSIFAGSFFYMFNIFSLHTFFQFNSGPVKAFAPWFIYWLVFGLDQIKRKQPFVKSSIYLALVSLGFSSSAVNLASASHIFIAAIIYWLTFIIFNLRTRALATRLFKFSALVFVLLFLVNLWWLVSTFRYSLENNQFISKIITDTGFLAETPLYETWRGLGFWAFKTYYQGIPLIPYAHYYYEPTLLLANFVLTIICLWGLKQNKFQPRLTIFFSIILVLALFLGKGVNEPWGWIFLWAYKNIPGFVIFRDPYGKFMPLWAFALAGLLTFSLASQRKKINFAVKSSLALVLIIISSFFIFSGDFIQNEDWYKDTNRSMYTKIPAYWQEMSAYLKNQPSGRILLTPKNAYGQTYNWPSGLASSGPPDLYLLNSDLLNYNHTPQYHQEESVNLIYAKIDDDQTILPQLKLTNVKYILQHNDLKTKQLLLNSPAPEIMLDFFRNSDYLNLKKSFGLLDLYELKSQYYQPIIYAPEIIFFSDDQNINNLKEEISPLDLTKKIALAPTEIQNELKASSPPEIIFQETNPSQYVVSIKNSREPFLLILSQTFHPRWQISLPASQAKHIEVNGGTNAWLINKGGDFRIKLYFADQKFLNIALAVSSVAIILSIIYLLKSRKSNNFYAD